MEASAIEDMPTHWKNHPCALRRRIDALTGLESWEKARTLAQDSLAVLPARADLWLCLARLQAHDGDFKGARESARKCIELRDDMKLEVVGDQMPAKVW